MTLSDKSARMAFRSRRACRHDSRCRLLAHRDDARLPEAHIR